MLSYRYETGNYKRGNYSLPSRVMRAIFFTLSVSILAAPVLAHDRHDDDDDGNNDNHGKMTFCSQTAKVVFRACGFEAKDDFWTEIGNCINVSDADERSECKADARLSRNEAGEKCAEQLEARRELCEALGEARYDPDFDPENFVDPHDIGNGVAPNPYFPLIAGNQRVYKGGDETITVTVTNKTKLIEGVTCLVVNDLVEEDGVPIENTDDWYAQDLEGNVWYCGEIAENFEVFEGDDPENPELVDIEGSWKAGRDGSKPGILVKATPQVGDIYRQEVSLGDAEDVAEVLSVTGTESAPAASCTNNCLVTRDFTPIEPGVNENKYYAPGIGLILEVDMEGNRVELVEVTP